MVRLDFGEGSESSVVARYGAQRLPANERSTARSAISLERIDQESQELRREAVGLKLKHVAAAHAYAIQNTRRM